ncbi:MAG: DEAD/DEAH box helicase [Bacteroidales bacterium]|nr:DEAD/DEAH box helicase [Bacteroidales bacterium]MBN2819787.1 DEAD/DEAH box helicase [Bacteroidales bacterium]
MQFVLVIADHRILGFVLAPYLVKPDKTKGMYLTYDKITLEKLKSYEQILSPEQIQIVKFIDNYSDQNLHKLFCKKKLTVHDFVNSIPEDLFLEHVRPYIDKQIVKCLDVLRYNKVPIYHKTIQNKIYESDRAQLIDEECETVFNFKRTEEGIFYKLTIEHSGEEVNLNGKEGVVIVNDPCCLAVEDKLFVFRDIDSKKVFPFFDKDNIYIPKKTERKYFETFVKSAIARYKVKAEGFEISELKSEPKAVISLERNLSGHLLLVLKFIYGSNGIYYANRKSGIKVSCNIIDDKVEFVKTQRDYDFENSSITKLLSFGLVNKEDSFFEPISKKEKSDCTYGPITWLNYNKKLLTRGGFEVAQSKLDKDFYLGNFELKFEVSEQANDWFDIMATVNFDGFKIPFVEFREYIVSGIREYVLPNNKVMILPEEWFESYSDLINFSNTEGQRLKLKKQHFSILNTSVSKLNKDFRSSLKSLLEIDKQDVLDMPEGVTAHLRPYQLEGYSWMWRLYQNGFGGCLADDMGLGKTLQTLTLLKKVTENAPVSDVKVKAKFETETQLSLFDTPAKPVRQSTKLTSLVVVPTSLVHNWINECRKFVPELSIQSFTGPSRGKLSDLIAKSDIIICSYGILRNDLDQFVQETFNYVVLDESQMVKNPGSKTYAAVVQLKAENRLVLSGTPIENSLTDLWAQFNFINPGLLGNLNFFQSEFQIPIERNFDDNKKERLQQLIAPFILRRTKSQVASELPELSEQILTCDLNDVQEAYYEREKSKARNLVLDHITQHGINRSSMQILQSLMKLRQIANHPSLVDEDYISGSGKFDEITRIISNLYQEDHKALIFSSFVGHLNLIANWLDEQGLKYTMLTGETRNREQVVKEFQEDEEIRFFLISLKAGGVGLNLTAASYVLMLDPWWNPASEKQAINRAHRIGQDKNVMVYRFIAQNTLEEKIIKLQERKSELADIFVNENVLGKISQEEIMELFD